MRGQGALQRTLVYGKAIRYGKLAGFLILVVGGMGCQHGYDRANQHDLVTMVEFEPLPSASHAGIIVQEEQRDSFNSVYLFT